MNILKWIHFSISDNKTLEILLGSLVFRHQFSNPVWRVPYCVLRKEASYTQYAIGKGPKRGENLETLTHS